MEIGTDGNNFGDEEKQSYIYSSSGDLSIEANKFSIDEQNLSALADGVSLFDILENSNLNEDYYLETKTDENSNEFLTFKKNGVVVNLKNDEPFSFVEFETAWQTAS